MTNLSEIVRDTVLLREYLNEGNDVNDNDNDIGFTLLHFARLIRAFESAKILLEEFKADPNIPNKQGYSPFHEAVVHKQKDFVELMAHNGGDPLHITSYPEGIQAKNVNALAFSLLSFDEDIFPSVFAAINPDSVNKNLIGYIVDYVVSHKPDIAVTCIKFIENSSYSDILTNLIKDHQHILLKDAAIKCSTDLMNFYLKYDLDFNHVYDEGGDTIGHYAVASKCLDIIKTFVETGKVDMNVVSDEQGKNALHSASADIAYDIVEYLLNNNYDVNFASNNGKVALHYAISALVKPEADEDYKKSFEEVQNGTIDVLLARPEINLDAQDKYDGATPLMYSAFLCKTQIFAKLVAKGANLTITDNKNDNLFKYIYACNDVDKRTNMTMSAAIHSDNLEEPDKMHFTKMWLTEMGYGLEKFYEKYPDQAPLPVEDL